MPTMDLEAAKSALARGDSIVPEGLDSVEASRLVLAMMGARIGWQPVFVSAQHGADRNPVFPADEIPQRNVQWSMTHVVIGPRLALEIVINSLPVFGVSAKQGRGEHHGLAESRFGADPMSHVSSLEPIFGGQAYRVTHDLETRTLFVEQIANPHRPVLPQPEIGHLEAEGDHFNIGYDAHRAAFLWPANVQNLSARPDAGQSLLTAARLGVPRSRASRPLKSLQPTANSSKTATAVEPFGTGATGRLNRVRSHSRRDPTPASRHNLARPRHRLHPAVRRFRNRNSRRCCRTTPRKVRLIRSWRSAFRNNVLGGQIAKRQCRTERDSGPGIGAIHDGAHVVAAGV